MFTLTLELSVLLLPNILSELSFDSKKVVEDTKSIAISQDVVASDATDGDGAGATVGTFSGGQPKLRIRVATLPADNRRRRTPSCRSCSCCCRRRAAVELLSYFPPSARIGIPRMEKSSVPFSYIIIVACFFAGTELAHVDFHKQKKNEGSFFCCHRWHLFSCGVVIKRFRSFFLFGIVFGHS